MSTQNAPPNQMSLQAFQDTLNENAVAVHASSTTFRHATLTMKKVRFTTTNKGTYTDLIRPGDRPSKPTDTVGVTTRSAIEADAGSTGTMITTPIIDPFEVQDTIGQFVQDQ